MSRRRCAWMSVALAALTACRGDGAATVAPDPTARVVFAAPGGEVPVDVEIADRPDEHRRGLMFRRELGANHGMLFVFAEEVEHPFWMKNTYLSLDMIFVSDGLRVVGVIADAEPLSEETVTIGRPSKYVVEVNAGFAEKHGIAAGTPMLLQLDTTASAP